jgi:hypothetical protein
VKVSLLHAKQAQRGGTHIALSILDSGTRMGWWLGPCLGCFTSIVKEAGLTIGAALNPGSLAHSMV